MGFEDIDTGLKLVAIEMDLADYSLKSFLEEKRKNKKAITDEEMRSICT